MSGENGINCYNAWNVTKGSSSVKVGVIDSGIYSNHVDLINRVNREISHDFQITVHLAVHSMIHMVMGLTWQALLELKEIIL